MVLQCGTKLDFTEEPNGVELEEAVADEEVFLPDPMENPDLEEANQREGLKKHLEQ